MLSSRFEYDPSKSRSNLEKHGIDFNQAQLIWQDPRRLRFKGNSFKEQRFALVGSALGKIWYAVYTVRRYKIRLISVRRARSSEVMAYEKEVE
ncbi:BrnT family toxin [Puniceicoccales bacterium CK1056]|uniref:BrnT family toxin n=1 Tax=Oceanipulchritudo coccoides TaxID=2706888 RepID=A0A6B2M2U2_9BACT|nr:BrnT family toxin [Oceanipulchritudo coccoides]NDV62716.1 BrnT family toxin [Oceanipulchritudo coccoides]